MTRQNRLEILLLLSALESWRYAEKHYLPDFLAEKLYESIKLLSDEVLKEAKDDVEELPQGFKDCKNRYYCQCDACKVAREVMDGLV